MYKGKFDAKSKGKQPVSAPQPRREAPVEPELPEEQAAPLREEFFREAPQEQPAAEPLREESREPQAEQPGKKAKKAKKAKKGPRVGTVIFYTLYFLMILGFCGGLYYAYGLLHDWLVDFQAAQPTTKCEEVFQDLFADPDWAALYAQAGIQDTTYEGSDAFGSLDDSLYDDEESDTL